MPVPIPLRAALLASWGSALLAGHGDVEDAVGAIEGADEPHLAVDGPFGEPDELATWLAELTESTTLGLRLALPAPGDLLGLVGPPSANQAALAAGEAVVAVPRTPADDVLMLVPDICTFGPPGDQGHCVTWRSHRAAATWPDVPTVGQADRELNEQIRESTSTLTALGTTSWSTDATTATTMLRQSARSIVLPESAGPRAQMLAQRAVGVLTILDAAREDDGGALSAHAAQARAASLSPLGRAARRALVASAGACLESSRRAGARP